MSEADGALIRSWRNGDAKNTGISSEEEMQALNSLVFAPSELADSVIIGGGRDEELPDLSDLEFEGPTSHSAQAVNGDISTPRMPQAYVLGIDDEPIPALPTRPEGYVEPKFFQGTPALPTRNAASQTTPPADDLSGWVREVEARVTAEPEAAHETQNGFLQSLAEVPGRARRFLDPHIDSLKYIGTMSVVSAIESLRPITQAKREATAYVAAHGAQLARAGIAAAAALLTIPVLSSYSSRRGFARTLSDSVQGVTQRIAGIGSESGAAESLSMSPAGADFGKVAAGLGVVGAAALGWRMFSRWRRNQPVSEMRNLTNAKRDEFVHELLDIDSEIAGRAPSVYENRGLSELTKQEYAGLVSSMHLDLVRAAQPEELLLRWSAGDEYEIKDAVDKALQRLGPNTPWEPKPEDSWLENTEIYRAVTDGTRAFSILDTLKDLRETVKGELREQVDRAIEAYRDSAAKLSSELGPELSADTDHTELMSSVGTNLEAAERTIRRLRSTDNGSMHDSLDTLAEQIRYAREIGDVGKGKLEMMRILGTHAFGVTHSKAYSSLISVADPVEPETFSSDGYAGETIMSIDDLAPDVDDLRAVLYDSLVALKSGLERTVDARGQKQAAEITYDNGAGDEVPEEIPLITEFAPSSEDVRAAFYDSKIELARGTSGVSPKEDTYRNMRGATPVKSGKITYEQIPSIDDFAPDVPVAAYAITEEGIISIDELAPDKVPTANYTRVMSEEPIAIEDLAPNNIPTASYKITETDDDIISIDDLAPDEVPTGSVRAYTGTEEAQESADPFNHQGVPEHASRSLEGKLTHAKGDLHLYLDMSTYHEQPTTIVNVNLPRNARRAYEEVVYTHPGVAASTMRTSENTMVGYDTGPDSPAAQPSQVAPESESSTFHDIATGYHTRPRREAVPVVQPETPQVQGEAPTNTPTPETSAETPQPASGDLEELIRTNPHAGQPAQAAQPAVEEPYTPIPMMPKIFGERMTHATRDLLRSYDRVSRGLKELEGSQVVPQGYQAKTSREAFPEMYEMLNAFSKAA